MTGELTPLGEQPRFAGGRQEIAPRTWAWIQPNGGLGESNAGLVSGDGESLLVDTLWDERLTGRMLAALAGSTADAPIRTIVNTHGDGDHWYGNGLLPDAEIHATEKAAKQMKEEPPTMLTRLSPLGPAAKLTGRLPLPGAQALRGIAGFADQLKNFEFGGISPRLPTQTFERELSLNVGGRAVEAIEVGPAHTFGDAIVHLPGERVVFSGDIVFNGITPIMWAGPLANWIAALERIAALEPVRVVPGHGPVCDLRAVTELRDYWRALDAQIDAAAADEPLPVAERLLESAEFRTAPWGSWANPERTVINVAMTARGKAGRGPINQVTRIRLLGMMGALRERLGKH